VYFIRFDCLLLLDLDLLGIARTPGRGKDDLSFTNAAELHDVNHNAVQAFRLWDNTTDSVTGIWPSLGDSDANRDGDRIMCTGMMLRGVVNFNANAQGAMIKLFYLPFESSQGDPLDTNALFHNATSYGGGVIGLWQVALFRRSVGREFVTLQRSRCLWDSMWETTTTQSDSRNGSP
jgi:hypothetical protein